MKLTGVDFFFWVSGVVSHIVLLCILLWRDRARQFPFFTTLVTANILRSVVLYTVLRSHGVYAYFYTYWSLAVLDVCLQLCVAAEVASHVFRPLGTWVPGLRRSSLLLVGCSTGAAALLTYFATPPGKLWQQTLVVRGSLFSSALLSELFVGAVALSVSMGLPWRTHVARIAQGFGVYSISEIVLQGIAGLHGEGYRRGTFFSLAHLHVMSYQLCLLYWIVMLARRAPSPRDLPEHMRQQLFALQARVLADLQVLRSWKA